MHDFIEVPLDFLDFGLLTIWIVVLTACIAVRRYWRGGKNPWDISENSQIDDLKEQIQKSKSLSSDSPKKQMLKLQRAAKLLVQDGEANSEKEAIQMISEEIIYGEENGSRSIELLSKQAKKII